MIEMIIGAFIGAVISLVIAEVYHRRSSRSMNDQILRLEEKNIHLGKMLDNLEEWQKQHFEDLQMIRKHSVAGTPDDPNFPYK